MISTSREKGRAHLRKYETFLKMQGFQNRRLLLTQEIQSKKLKLIPRIS